MLLPRGRANAPSARPDRATSGARVTPAWGRAVPGAQEALRKTLARSFLPSFLPWLDSKRSGQGAWHSDAKVFREVGSDAKSDQQCRGREGGGAARPVADGSGGTGSEGQARAAGLKAPAWQEQVSQALDGPALRLS